MKTTVLKIDTVLPSPKYFLDRFCFTFVPAKGKGIHPTHPNLRNAWFATNISTLVTSYNGELYTEEFELIDPSDTIEYGDTVVRTYVMDVDTRFLVDTEITVLTAEGKGVIPLRYNGSSYDTGAIFDLNQINRLATDKSEDIILYFCRNSTKWPAFDISTLSGYTIKSTVMLQGYRVYGDFVSFLANNDLSQSGRIFYLTNNSLLTGDVEDCAKALKLHTHASLTFSIRGSGTGISYMGETGVEKIIAFDAQGNYTIT